MRLGLIGCGAIGSQVAKALMAGKTVAGKNDRSSQVKNQPLQIPGLDLVAILDPYLQTDDPIVKELLVDYQTQTLAELISAKPDVVVEAAGHSALKEYMSPVLLAGMNLLVLSVGAFSDEELFRECVEVAAKPNAGKLVVSTGAIGGIDILGAVKMAGALSSASLTSIKPPQNFLVPSLDPEMKSAIQAASGAASRAASGAATGTVEVFSGSVREAAQMFPQSANVAATLGLTTMGLDETRAILIADPATDKVTHKIQLEGSAGLYEFSFINRPSPLNPKTSEVVPYAVLRALKMWSHLTDPPDTLLAPDSASGELMFF